MNTHNREGCRTDQDDKLIGLAKLMRMAYSGVDLAPLGAKLIERAGTNPGTASANALMDLFTVLLLRGERELALSMQAEALQIQQIYSAPTASGQAAIRLLAVMTPGDLMANTPLEFLLEDSDVALDMLYVGQGLPFPASLPDHDLLFIAIAESDQNLPLLAEIGSAIKAWPRPVLNRPDRIALMSRNDACALLKGVPGVVMPDTVRAGRQILEQVSRQERGITDTLGDGDFPVIVRPVDSHAGQGLDKIDNAAAMADYLLKMPNSEFYVARFVNYRSKDGQFRKYRIVLIEGQPYICHLAISEHWMIHYLNAGMAGSAEKRAEEARAMADFDGGFARRHTEALRTIGERAGLDYLGIDCGETADGQLLIFEIDSCMIVHAIDPVDVFPYKQPQMRKVFDAFRRMLGHAMQRAVL
ncbi:MAG: RimK family alpha-L-glutamate ligase [Gallionella sp.]|nr:RimK family alpha-L-glutamate ligase [Gallionella sp.]